MIIYVEKLVLIDAFIHYFFLIMTSTLLHFSFKKISLIASILLDSLYVIISINFVIPLIIKFLVLFLLVYIFLSFKRRYLFKATIIYFLLSSLCQGFMEVLGTNYYNAFLSLIFFCVLVIVAYGYLSLKVDFLRNKLFYDIEVRFSNKSYKLKGFLDTGLKANCDGYEVIFLNSDIKFEVPLYSEVAFFGLGKEKVKLYLFDEVIIKRQKKQVLIGFIEMEYEALIGLENL